MEEGQRGEKKTLHHANDLAPGSFSFCQESPFQFEWIWIKRISHKGQVWPKQHFVCKSTGSQSSGPFLPLSCSHYRRPTCQRQLSVNMDDVVRPTNSVLNRRFPSCHKFGEVYIPPQTKHPLFITSHYFPWKRRSFLFSTTSTYLRGSWDKLIGETRRLVHWLITRPCRYRYYYCVTIIARCGQTAVFNKWRQKPKGTHTITVEGKQH